VAQTDGPNTFRPTTAWRALRRILRTYPCIERAAAPREGSKTAQSSRRCCGPRRHNFRDHADYELAHRRWPAEWLVAIWNSLPGVTPVKKFKDQTTAATRVWKSIQELGEALKPQPAQPVQPKVERKANGDAQSAKGTPTKGKAILRTLLPGPNHGHAIAKHIQRTSEELLQVETGSLYPALHRLEAKDWIV
jgi:hypothetical protein